MGKVCQIILGPAGSGKSTYCHQMQEHFTTIRRTCHIFNLDPAADPLPYNPTIDIRDLVSLEDVMNYKSMGPNGGLVYCMEYISENFEWIGEQLGDFEDDYLLVDCPGQVELYTHYTVMVRVFNNLVRLGYRVCVVHLLDAHFMSDAAKYISGVMGATAVMYRLELPHVNVISKLDLWENPEDLDELDKYLETDVPCILAELNEAMSPQYRRLNEALGEMLNMEGMVSFIPLNFADESSIHALLAQIDAATQYGEDLEPLEPNDFDEDE